MWCLCILCNYSCLIGTLSTHAMAVIYTVVKVGSGMGQDPATEVTHLRLSQPPVFSSVAGQIYMDVACLP